MTQAAAGVSQNEQLHHITTAELILAAVKQNGMALEFIPERLRTDAVVAAAVKQNGLAIKFIPFERQTPQLKLSAVTQNGMAIQFVMKDDSKWSSIEV